MSLARKAGVPAHTLKEDGSHELKDKVELLFVPTVFFLQLLDLIGLFQNIL